MNRRRTIDRTTESSSGKIRQSSYNHAESRQAAGVQDPAARRAAQALAGPVRAARRADQERTPRAGCTAAYRAGADARGAREPHRGARGRGGAARRRPRDHAPGRGRLRLGRPAACAVSHRARAHADAGRHPQRHGASSRGRDRVGRHRRRACLARAAARDRPCPASNRARRGVRQVGGRRRPFVPRRHCRCDRQPRVRALPAVHRPPPHPAAHGERAARAHGWAEGLPRADPGGAPAHLRGDRRARCRCGARGHAAASHPLARALPQARRRAPRSRLKILLTHSPEAIQLYYGERALAGLRELGEVVLNENSFSLEGEALIAAARDCDLIVSYRQSPGPAALFERLPKLIAFLRCAIDIRNVDVAAASKAGVLVTQASAGFVTSVAEMVLVFLGDLSRGITHSATEYRAGRVPGARMGRELKGSTLGVIGYAAIGKEVVRIGKALGMRVLIHDPYHAVEQVPLEELLAQADYVVPLAVANAETENLIGEHAFSLMKRGAYLINVSRGNLVE